MLHFRARIMTPKHMKDVAKQSRTSAPGLSRDRNPFRHLVKDMIFLSSYRAHVWGVFGVEFFCSAFSNEVGEHLRPRN